MRDILFRSLSQVVCQHEKLRYQKQKQLKKFGSNPNVQIFFLRAQRSIFFFLRAQRSN